MRGGGSGWRAVLVLGLVSVLLVGAGACGGGNDDDDESSGEQDSSSVSQVSDEDDSSDSAKDDGDAERKESSGSVPALGNYSFQNGKVTVHVTGDEESDFEAEGSSITVAGRTVMTFAGEDGQITIGLGKDDSNDQKAGFGMTTKDVLVGGSFDEGDCSIDIDEDEPTKLSGSFECDDIEATSPSSPTKKLTVDLEGEFDFAS